jgi:Protein of unknown function (DUF3224)
MYAVGMNRISGRFEVKLTPHAPTDQARGAFSQRMLIEKTFFGDLEGTSIGEMMASRTAVENSAGYVALERVMGKLLGKSGSFVLQHSSLMNRGEPTQSITVIPDSGTGELEGLRGLMKIRIESKQHFYDFDFEL